MRRLCVDWFNDKFYEEVTGPLVMERIYKRYMQEQDGGGAPRPKRCEPHGAICAIIWLISDGWPGRGTGLRATG